MSDDGLGLALQPDPARLTLARFLEDIASRYGERVALRFEASVSSPTRKC